MAYLAVCCQLFGLFLESGNALCHIVLVFVILTHRTTYLLSITGRKAHCVAVAARGTLAHMQLSLTVDANLPATCVSFRMMVSRRLL